jgi:hypothetical protein
MNSRAMAGRRHDHSIGTPGLMRLSHGVSMAALLVCVTAGIAAAQTSPAQYAVPDIRGTQEVNPRDVTVDPRFVQPENPFQPLARRPFEVAAPALPQPATRRTMSRASRPVQARVSGNAGRAIRPVPRQLAGTPLPDAAGQPPLRLRRTTSTQIIAPAPDGLQPYPPRAPVRPLADPWEPLGLRAGSFVVSPAITQSLGYDTNPNRSPTAAKGSVVSRTDGELNVRSDWSTHSFTSSLRGGYANYTNQRDASRPDATGLANLKLNLSRDTDIDLDGRLSLDTQRPGSTNFSAITTERPNVYGYGASAGVTQRYNRLSLNLRGSVDRTTYDNAKDSLGALILQSDRNAVQYGARARVGYEVSPGVQPFVEIAADTRVFDSSIDQNGFRRSSTGVTGRIGSSLEVTRQLTGEISVGYQNRGYDDQRLRDLRGVVGDAALIWSATPLTTVSLRGATELADTTLPNVSGSINRRLGVEVAHALRRNWTMTGFANASRATYDGNGLTEDTYQLGVRTEYRLTRTTSIRASFTHERLKSTTAGSDYTANIVLVGLRMQL